ncbi:hypothetical protein L1887_55577 [Cichorium endivia]|nr:hypothetical protein L1887_55577 [Cichorium endivia]
MRPAEGAAVPMSPKHSPKSHILGWLATWLPHLHADSSAFTLSCGVPLRCFPGWYLISLEIWRVIVPRPRRSGSLAMITCSSSVPARVESVLRCTWHSDYALTNFAGLEICSRRRQTDPSRLTCDMTDLRLLYWCIHPRSVTL